jgi:hypothetical protein
MPRRRPVLANAGAVACLAALAALVAACSPGPVAMDSPDLNPADAQACQRLVDALPHTVADQPARDVDGRYGAAWGDPPIVLRCGVGRPTSFDELSSCQITNEIAWYIPEEQIIGGPVDIVMTTIGRSVNVEVQLPAEYFPPANAMVDLADAVTETTTETEPCGV